MVHRTIMLHRTMAWAMTCPREGRLVRIRVDGFGVADQPKENPDDRTL